MILVGSKNTIVGMKEAMDVLRSGGSVCDAVETGVRAVESDPQEHSVGYSGYPNLLGQVELDAAIMDGRTLTTGAVGALQGYEHPISVARRVMEKLPHVFLVGEGAARFAREMGFEPRELLTEEVIREVWERRMGRPMTPEALQEVSARTDLWKDIPYLISPEWSTGTTNLIAQDDRGNLCVGTSTSGWQMRYPGRLGDSPVIGAGLYADSRYGAAACTGTGEMAIRACTAHSVICYLREGAGAEEAGRRAMLDLNHLGGRYISRMNIVVLDGAGHHAAFSSRPGEIYLYMTDSMSEPERVDRTVIPLEERWGKDRDS